jgi:hypothetical protein
MLFSATVLESGCCESRQDFNLLNVPSLPQSFSLRQIRLEKPVTSSGLLDSIGMAPFVINVQGRAEIPHPTERALINVYVASSGTNKAIVSSEVITTTKKIEALLRELSAQDESAEAKDAAPLAHWSMYFDIRFKEFKTLGSFGTKLSALPHVEIGCINWGLTPSTMEAYRAQLRKEAAQDALQKAQDYCDVLGCANLHPVELYDDQVPRITPSNLVVAHQQQQMAQHQQMAQWVQEPGSASNCSWFEKDLEFTPQEVQMSTQVTVKFHAE